MKTFLLRPGFELIFALSLIAILALPPVLLAQSKKNVDINIVNGRNSQNFDYVSTDEDGISTHVTFHVSEVSNDDLKRMPHVEGGRFEISDLNLVPEFSTGKTLLMFDLPAKTAAEVKLTDSEGKILWNEKTAGGHFSKTFVFGLNGVYYLQVKQGHNISVKKIMKEQ
jgi:hypothetical protein